MASIISHHRLSFSQQVEQVVQAGELLDWLEHHPGVVEPLADVWVSRWQSEKKPWATAMLDQMVLTPQTSTHFSSFWVFAVSALLQSDQTCLPEDITMLVKHGNQNSFKSHSFEMALQFEAAGRPARGRGALPMSTANRLALASALHECLPVLQGSGEFHHYHFAPAFSSLIMHPDTQSQALDVLCNSCFTARHIAATLWTLADHYTDVPLCVTDILLSRLSDEELWSEIDAPKLENGFARSFREQNVSVIDLPDVLSPRPATRSLFHSIDQLCSWLSNHPARQAPPMLDTLISLSKDWRSNLPHAAAWCQKSAIEKEITNALKAHKKKM